MSGGVPSCRHPAPPPFPLHRTDESHAPNATAAAVEAAPCQPNVMPRRRSHAQDPKMAHASEHETTDRTVLGKTHVSAAPLPSPPARPSRESGRANAGKSRGLARAATHHIILEGAAVWRSADAAVSRGCVHSTCPLVAACHSSGCRSGTPLHSSHTRTTPPCVWPGSFSPLRGQPPHSLFTGGKYFSHTPHPRCSSREPPATTPHLTPTTTSPHLPQALQQHRCREQGHPSAALRPSVHDCGCVGAALGGGRCSPLPAA